VGKKVYEFDGYMLGDSMSKINEIICRPRETLKRIIHQTLYFHLGSLVKPFF